MAVFNTADLVKRAAAGDIGAFEELVRSSKQPLYSYLLGMTGGDHATAADILQETFIKAFLNIKKFRGECSFITWLLKISRHEYIDYRTSPKTSENTLLDDIPERDFAYGKTIESSLAMDQQREALYKVLAMLSHEHREVIVLVDLQEMRYDEAASLLGISEGALKSRLFRARERLLQVALEHKKLFV